MKKQPEQSVHIRIDRPIDRRKAILEATITAVELLKRKEEILRLRAEREKELAKFQKTVKSVLRLVKQVRLHDLPLDARELRGIRNLSGHKALAKPRKVPKKKAAKKAKKAATPKKSSIDQQLDDLHRKLQSL